MSKKVILLIAFMMLNVYGTSYAAARISGNKSVSKTSSSSKSISQQASGRLASNGGNAADIPDVSKRRTAVKHTINRLIAFSRKASSDIRGKIKEIKAQKNKRINDADIKTALDMADKFDRYALLLSQKEKSLPDNNSDIDKTLRATATLTRQLMMQLENEMNEQQRTTQILNNMMKNQHATLEGINRNLK